MNGLKLSREYLMNTALPDFEEKFPELLPRLAAGLVGNGSECFGFDDEISRDHDWGIDFFIWLTETDRERIPELAAWKKKLFEDHPPEFIRSQSEYGGLITIETTGDFYRSLIGLPAGPKTMVEWVNTPEDYLAMACNGEVFIDNAGEFTQTREHLLKYLPEDLRLKRLSYRCMIAAQSGQYNFERCLTRGDTVAARAYLDRFLECVIAIVFLINRQYLPYHKWRYRAMLDLPVLSAVVATLIRQIAELSVLNEAKQIGGSIEEICHAVADELFREGLCETRSAFLVSQGEELRGRIQHEGLRNLPAQREV